MEAVDIRVLVAEDNPVNQLVAVQLLKRRGLSVDAADDGRQAVDMHVVSPYDAIFMDCQMPRLDGFQATQEIRRHDADRRHTPIIALTANTLPSDVKRCFDAGMDYFEGKPLTLEALDAVLAHALVGVEMNAGNSDT